MNRSGKLEIKSDMKPAGDQPEAISALVNGINKGSSKQEAETDAARNALEKKGWN
jgi:excinuclease UvrABC helicase subunit UvrB